MLLNTGINQYVLRLSCNSSNVALDRPCPWYCHGGIPISTLVYSSIWECIIFTFSHEFECCLFTHMSCLQAYCICPYYYIWLITKPCSFNGCADFWTFFKSNLNVLSVSVLEDIPISKRTSLDTRHVSRQFTCHKVFMVSLFYSRDSDQLCEFRIKTYLALFLTFPVSD